MWSVLSLIAGVVVLKSSGEPHRAGRVKLNKHHPSGELPLRAAVSLPCLPATQLSSSPREPSGTTHLSSGGSVMVQHRRGRSVTDSCCVLTVGSKLNIQKCVRGYEHVATEMCKAMREGSYERIRAGTHRMIF